MYFKSKTFILVCLLCGFCLPSHAQLNDYRAEIGVLGGAAYYLGDANLTPFRHTTIDYGALFRYRFDTRFAARAEVSRARLYGGSGETAFDHVVNMLDLCGEFNFFDLERNEYKRFSKTFAPYLFVGVGFMDYSYEQARTLGVSIPFGIGIKVKLGGRFNFNAQFSNRLLLKDDLEGVAAYNDPNGLNGGNLLNNDLLQTLTVGITFDIWKRGCDCHKL